MIETFEVNTPGIPGGNNHWFPSQGQARNNALAAARQLGSGYRIVHHPRPRVGLPHYHLANPDGSPLARTHPSYGHFFYGHRPPRRIYRGRPWREFEHELESRLEFQSTKPPTSVGGLAENDREMPYRPTRMVLNICQQASQRANQLRGAIQQSRTIADPQRRQYELQRLRGHANFFVRRWANQAMRYIPQLHPYDIDYLIGCLARLEHAVGSSLPALGPLRTVARQRLGESEASLAYYEESSNVPVLRYGSQGPAVRELQRQLNQWLQRTGRPTLVVDGIFGSRVNAAVRAFQKAMGLTVDGIVGLQTRRALINPPLAQSSSSAAVQLAQDVLNHPGISLWRYSPVASSASDGADALSNIRDTANGRPARRSNYGNAPGGTVALNTRMLQGLLQLANTYDIRVTSIAGGTHNPSSRHYAGVAFDVDKINGAQVNLVNPYYQALMQRCRELGAVEIMGPGDSGHNTHVHCAWPR